MRKLDIQFMSLRRIIIELFPWHPPCNIVCITDYGYSYLGSLIMLSETFAIALLMFSTALIIVHFVAAISE